MQVGDRKIIVTAIIDLTVDSPGGSIQQVENIAISAGGFVSGSSLTVEPIRNRDDDDEGPAERERGTITIRVPVSQYASVMNQLRGLGERMSENSQANEVTEEYADLQSRLRNLEATEARYLELLTQAESINDILTVQDRLSQVRLQIEQIQGRINLLDDLSDLATITVNLAMPPDDIEQQTIEEDDEPHWARQAWDDAWSASEEVLQTLGTIGITAGVILMWLLVPGLLIVLGWRLWPRGAGREA